MKKLLIGLITASALMSTAHAALEPFQTFTGNVAMSTDGFGSLQNTGIISASVPAGSTVVAAYLYTSTFRTNNLPTVSLAGSTVSFGPRVANTTACCNLASARADVTSIIKPLIDGTAGGLYDFDIAETALGNSTDGEALVIVYENAALPVATVGILDGFASVTGDTASINFANPLDPADPAFFAEMILGISFSCCDQKSTVNVNGSLLTNNAGNNDDGINLADGSLITVGSFDDPFSPINPSYTADSERYDLSPFVNAGDTSIVIDTINGSRDDNIFLAGFYLSGLAAINTPPPTGPGPTVGIPEPGTSALLGLGLLGLIIGRRRSSK